MYDKSGSELLRCINENLQTAILVSFNLASADQGSETASRALAVAILSDNDNPSGETNPLTRCSEGCPRRSKGTCRRRLARNPLYYCHYRSLLEERRLETRCSDIQRKGRLR